MVPEIESLLREGRLQEARRLGEQAVAADPHDDDAMRALVGVYIDIEARCIETGVTAYLPEISDRIDQLLASMKQADGEQRRRHARLVLAALPGYRELHVLEELSARDGNEKEAYGRARELVHAGGIAPGLIEIYATILYRWARVAMTDPDSRPLREALFEYLGLPLAKPSRLHSLVLRLAVRAARKYPDFSFSRFFDLWNPRTFREEDIIDPDRKYSLAAAAFELVIDSADACRFPELLERVKASVQVRMSILREAFDTLVSRNIRAGDNSRAIDLLRLYAGHSAIHAADRFHSRLLASALRVMVDDEKWRFVSFFIDWDTSLFREADYRPSAHAASLVSRAVKRVFAAVKADPQRHAHLLAPLLEAYDRVVAASPSPDDELSVRRRSMLLTWMERDNDAIRRMSAMAAAAGHRSPAFWLDFAAMVPSRDTKLGLLALGALQLEYGNTGYDDSEIAQLRLSLAQLLHVSGDDDSAVTELQLSAAEPMARYGAIKSAISPSATPNYSNLLLYHRLAANALAVIYNSVRSVNMTVLKQHDRMVYLVSDTVTPVAVDTVLWPLLASLSPGAVVEVKRDDSGVVMARPVEAEPYSALPLVYGIVIGPGRVQCGGRPAPVDCEAGAETGSTVSLSTYIDAEYNTHGLNLSPAPRAMVIRLFASVVAAVAGISGNMAVLTAGPDGPDFRIAMPGSSAVGTVYRVSYYTDRRGHAMPVDTDLLPADTPCDAISTISGKLDLHPDGTASVRQATVSAGLRQEVPPQTYVSAKILYHPDTRTWQALSVTPYT